MSKFLNTELKSDSKSSDSDLDLDDNKLITKLEKFGCDFE